MADAESCCAMRDVAKIFVLVLVLLLVLDSRYFRVRGRRRGGGRFGCGGAAPCRWWLRCSLFPCCAEFWELRPPASVETLRRTNSPLCLPYSFDSISPGIAPGKGAFTEGMRFRFGYRSETSAVAGTVLKMRFITSVRSKL